MMYVVCMYIFSFFSYRTKKNIEKKEQIQKSLLVISYVSYPCVYIRVAQNRKRCMVLCFFERNTLK